MGTLTPGQWYLLFTCPKCAIKQVLFLDLSEGKAEIGAVYHVPCRECGHEGAYGGDSLERYQHPTEVEMSRAATQH